MAVDSLASQYPHYWEVGTAGVPHLGKDIAGIGESSLPVEGTVMVPLDKGLVGMRVSSQKEAGTVRVPRLGKDFSGMEGNTAGVPQLGKGLAAIGTTSLLEGVAEVPLGTEKDKTGASFVQPDY